jgi:hypothetical protein
MLPRCRAFHAWVSAKQAFPTPCDIHSTATNCTLFAATDASWAALASYLSKTMDQLATTPVMTPVSMLHFVSICAYSKYDFQVRHRAHEKLSTCYHWSVTKGVRLAQCWACVKKSLKALVLMLTPFLVVCLSCSTISSSPSSASMSATWRMALPTRPYYLTSS